MRLLIETLGLIFIIVFLISNSCFAQFTADMIQSEGDQVTTSKLFVENPYYCIETEEDGETILVIVDQEEKVTRVLRPSEKMYIEMGSQSMMSMANDVFQSIDNMNETYDTALIGTETINSYECEKYIVSFEGEEMLTYWQSSQLGYPLKVVNAMVNGMAMELINIVEGDIDDSRFTIPSDYTKMER
ncbi:MAG: DUF4412 domain-containing protein [Ignavibacteria bacterium]|nr:DUF4412 domain-containing protein [Ignavibacteria bacterium]